MLLVFSGCDGTFTRVWLVQLPQLLVANYPIATCLPTPVAVFGRVWTVTRGLTWGVPRVGFKSLRLCRPQIQRTMGDGTFVLCLSREET